MRNYLILYILSFCLPVATRGQITEELYSLVPPQPTTATSLRYWFDDETTVFTVSHLNGQHSIDVSVLLDGLHTLHCQVVDNTGAVTAACSRVFLKEGILNQIASAKSLRYWFDDNNNHVQLLNVSGSTITLDVSSLLDGLHTLHYQIVDNEEHVSYIRSGIFLKKSQQSGPTTAQSLRYWFDDDISDVKTTTQMNGIQMLDVSSLLEGLHTLHYQIVDNKGLLSAPTSSVFLKMTEHGTATTSQRIYYWFDDNQALANETEAINGTQMLDVSELMNGLHTIHYQIKDGKGNVSAPVSHIFFKNLYKTIADDEKGIVKYEYWLNKRKDQTHTVALTERTNPLSLITMLPVETQPIRSTNFVFFVEEGTPCIYGVNDFTIRFYDANSSVVETTQKYTDYQSRQELTDITLLKHGDHKTVDSPTNNAICWFKFDGELSDAVSFRTDQPATLQVFNSDGQVIFSVQGDAATKVNSLLIPAEGIYYVALHDVKGTESQTSLDFTHQYAIAFKPGDVNDDRSVNVADITMFVNYILGYNPEEFMMPAADVNKDAELDVFDITQIVGLILSQEGGNPSAQRRADMFDEEEPEPANIAYLGTDIRMSIDNPERFTSFQFDIQLPKGIDIINTSLVPNKNHTIQFAKIYDNTYRVVVFSLANELLPNDSQELFEISLSNTIDEPVIISNLLFVTPDNRIERFEAMTQEGPTGLDNVLSDDENSIYDLSGRKLTKGSDSLGKGVYIINQQKVIIK